jgi:hypothetical protein
MLFRVGSNGKIVIFLNLIVVCTLGLLLSTSITTTQVYATAADQVTNQVFIRDAAGTEYELKLRATEEDGRIDKVPGFTLEAERVPQIDEGKDLVLNVKINDPATGQQLPDSRAVNNIKITDPNTGQIIKALKPTTSNVFSLLGVKPGIYQLDAIVQLTDDTNGAYEGILTVLAPGQDAPPADQVRNVQNTVITRNPDPVFIPVPVGVPVPVPTAPVSPTAPFQPLAGQQPPQPLAGQQQPPQPLAGQQQPPQPLAGQQQPPQPLAGQQQPPQPLAGQQQIPLNPASTPVDPCIENPDLPECLDPCIENPDLPECQPSQPTPLEGTEPTTDQAASGQSDTNEGTSGEGEDTGESEGDGGDDGDGGDSENDADSGDSGDEG